MCDGDVLEGDVELVGALEELGSDAVADGFTLGDEFCGVELCDDGFEDFVSDGGEDTLVVVETEILTFGQQQILCNRLTHPEAHFNVLRVGYKDFVIPDRS